MELYGGSWFICFRTFDFTTNVLLLSIYFKNVKELYGNYVSFQCEIGTVKHEQLLL